VTRAASVTNAINSINSKAGNKGKT
jgi:hypothetical protein